MALFMTTACKQQCTNAPTKQRRNPQNVVLLLAGISVFSVARLTLNPLGMIFHQSLRQNVVMDQIISSQPQHSSSCTENRQYPWPDHHSGLPYLGDVFASHDAKWVYFVGVNRGVCQKEYLLADSFAAQNGHQFMCVFPDNVYVISEIVHPTPKQHSAGFVIQCRIPPQFQNLVQHFQTSTTLHVDLHAMHDLELYRSGTEGIRQYPSGIVTEMPRLSQLPVCHPVTRDMRPKQYKLTAFTRVKSSYLLGQHNETARTTMDPLPRVLEWIEYHKQQGFDHFVIYDNDAEPHGPFERLLAPLVKSGLVTYRWFPMKDCWRQYGVWKDYLNPSGQVAASLAALHRMSQLTEFYAHMDVDEYFVPLNQNTTVLETTMKMDPSFDVLEWQSTVMVPCNGTTVEADASPLSKWKCLSDRHLAGNKLIMRADRMLYFSIHYPVVTMDGTVPRSYTLNNETEGFLAHYRPNPGLAFWRDDYSGLVCNNYTKETDFMYKLT